MTTALAQIPFRQTFRESLLSGDKTATTRTRIMVQAGESFEAFGARFEVVDVKRLSLNVVKGHY